MKRSLQNAKVFSLSISLLFILLGSKQLVAQGSLQGTAMENESGLAAVGATVAVYSADTLLTGALSDSNGNYLVSDLAPGVYNIICGYVGFKDIRVDNVIIKNDSITKLDFSLLADSEALDEFLLVGYSMPLIGVDATVSGVTIRSSDLSKLNTGNESYKKQKENKNQSVSSAPLSTFSVDVDKASYSNVRRFINGGSLPPVDAVRTEELINYFEYDYAAPDNNETFNILTELSDCPWNSKNLLLKIGLKGKEIPQEDLPASNIVFLLDVSGSMDIPEKLPLLQSSLKLLLSKLDQEDRVAIVVYAGSAGLVLPSTRGDEKDAIISAIDNLNAGGSTAGGEGLELAYKVAQENYIEEGNNRIILATDGDFNVGISSEEDMTDFIEKKRDEGIAISVLGFGMGNYKDDRMELIADKGNGNYAYIDNLMEARKVLVKEFGGTLFTIANDVKIQVEFNPKYIAKYRLIGYENRLLNEEDFEDDKKDAGDVGSGHTVTALYELIPTKSKNRKVGRKLKYQSSSLTAVGQESQEIATVKLRYKEPNSTKSELMDKSIMNTAISFSATSTDFKFCASIAQFSMLLKDSRYLGTSSWNSVVALAKEGLGPDSEGYRKEYINILETARLLK